MRLLGFAAVALVTGGIGSAAHAVPTFTDLNATTPEALVSALLAPTSGITINSVTYAGANIASGLFTNGNSSNIGFDNGVALTTGTLDTLPTGFNTRNLALGNPRLEQYNGGVPTTEAATLTIEFTPVGNQISLFYVFGSNDYQFTVGTAFNDVFAAEVNGINRALVPGTDSPVSINTVNCGDFSGNNAANCDQFRDNRFGDITDLDLEGLTQIFQLTANVTAGVINTLTLSIADSQDPDFDSVVFLRSGSFLSCNGPGLPECNGNGGPPPGEVPEPGMIGILGLAALGIASLRRRRPDKH